MTWPLRPSATVSNADLRRGVRYHGDAMTPHHVSLHPQDEVADVGMGKVPALLNVRVRLWLQPTTAPARLRGQLASCLAWPPKTPLGKRPPSTFHGILG